MNRLTRWIVTWLFAALVIVPIGRAQDAAQPAPFKKEEIEQLVAPIALYPDAPGGAYDYVAQGKMIGGFALVAWPANYGNSGVMTFLVNHDSVVYDKDLGPETAGVARKITRFNPDKSWRRS